MMNQQEFMARAIALAEQGNGYVSPNPMVGAVIVKNGSIIGEGYHVRYGEQHAEIMAIENAVESVEGAELYCNLEPCCHSTPEKKTPPCTKRLIAEKIRSVYIATLDPNPYVWGKGVAVLQDAGIQVNVGLSAEAARDLNERYFKFIQTRQPFVHLKIAASLDGRIATASGHSKWITDPDALEQVHQMRHTHDAVMVGMNTVRLDNPRLTVRRVQGRHPYRIVLDKHLTIAPESHLIQDALRKKTILFTTDNHDEQRRARLEADGVIVRIVPGEAADYIDLKMVLTELGKMNIGSLLVEGGQGIFTQFVRKRIFDKLSLFIAPLIIGKGIEAIGDLDINLISQAIRLKNVQITSVNAQALIQGYRNIEETFGRLASNEK